MDVKWGISGAMTADWNEARHKEQLQVKKKSDQDGNVEAFGKVLRDCDKAMDTATAKSREIAADASKTSFEDKIRVLGAEEASFQNPPNVRQLQAKSAIASMYANNISKQRYFSSNG